MIFFKTKHLICLKVCDSFIRSKKQSKSIFQRWLKLKKYNIFWRYLSPCFWYDEPNSVGKSFPKPSFCYCKNKLSKLLQIINSRSHEVVRIQKGVFFYKFMSEFLQPDNKYTISQIKNSNQILNRRYVIELIYIKRFTTLRLRV